MSASRNVPGAPSPVDVPGESSGVDRPGALRGRGDALGPRPGSVERILVVRLGALGDVLRTLPAVAGLRALHPAARITWLVEPAAAGAVALSPAVDDVLVFPRPALVAALRARSPRRLSALLRDFLRTLRAPGFDCVVDFHGILRSGVLGRLSGARTRIGYDRPFAREGNALLTTHRAGLGRARRSRYARNAGLVQALGGAEVGRRERFLAVPDAARERVTRALAGRPPGVVLHPGTSPGTPFKRWAPERFAALAQRLASETGVPCLVTAGPGEAEARLAQAVVDGSRGAARCAPDTAELADLAALIEMAPLFVGADSGPLHLASLVGTPVVQILGPTDPIENAPWRGTPSRSVRAAVPCSPCRRGCASPACMASVPVDAVAGAARALASAPADAGTWPPWRAA